MLEDIAHVVAGDLRRALFITELLVRRGLHTDRNALGLLLQETEVVEMRMVIEEALRGRLHDWRWEKQGAKNTRVLYGAMGHLDRLMATHHLEGDQVIEHIHQHLVEGRFHLPSTVLADLLDVVAQTDADLRRASTARIHLEAMLHRFAEVGRGAGLAPA
jgi:DNA polymerase III delta prime subunit